MAVHFRERAAFAAILRALNYRTSQVFDSFGGSPHHGGRKRRPCFADPDPRLICEAPVMDEAVILVPEMWAAFPALAKTAALA